MQLLLVDPEPLTTGLLSDGLRSSGFRVTSTQFGARLLIGQYAHAAALVIDGGPLAQRKLEIIDRLRRAGVKQPMMVLSCAGDWRSKVECLDAGADDYLVWPVRSEEVAARLRALIRRTAGNPTDRIVDGGFELDLKARCAWLNGKCLDLTKTEFRLLRLLVFASGRVVSHQEIRTMLYSECTDVSANAVEVQIARLRRKVGKTRIRTMRGIGYRYVSATGDAVPETLELDKEACWRKDR